MKGTTVHLKMWMARMWYKDWKEWFLLNLAHRCPKQLRYWIVIDAWAKATTGQYGTTDPTTLRVDDMLKRIS